MTGLKSGRSIQEFWIDFLLEEEFSCCPRFAAAFAQACGLALDEAAPIEVTHSAVDEFGEADLVVRFTVVGSDARVALLIENKITAAFQPEQAARYRQRGQSGVDREFWADYRTVLVAPDRYIQSGHGFDFAIALETLAEWIGRADPSRHSYKSARLLKAIEKKNATGIQVIDPVMTEFRAWYGQHLAEFGAGFVPPASRLQVTIGSSGQANACLAAASSGTAFTPV